MKNILKLNPIVTALQTLNRFNRLPSAIRRLSSRVFAICHLPFAIAAVAVLASVAPSSAQTNTPTPPSNFFPTNLPVAPFISQLANWVSSYDTNKTWTNVNFQIDTGIATTTGEQIADRLNLKDNFLGGKLEAGISGEFTGVGSAFSELEAVAGYALVEKYDFKLCAEIGGGYDFNKTDAHGKRVGAIVANPGLAAYKAITGNTYATVGYSFPIESVGKFNAAGTFYVGAGFTF